MDFLALVPLMAPAVVIIVVAVVIIRNERCGPAVVLDLTDVPPIRLAEQVTCPITTSAVGQLSGDLVAARGASLGARMQRVAGATRATPSPAPSGDIRPRRRGTPLVAARS